MLPACRAVSATSRIGLSLELRPAAFAQFIKDRSLDVRSMKEQFLAARVTNKAETSVTKDTVDFARKKRRHATTVLPDRVMTSSVMSMWYYGRVPVVL